MDAEYRALVQQVNEGYKAITGNELPEALDLATETPEAIAAYKRAVVEALLAVVAKVVEVVTEDEGEDK